MPYASRDGLITTILNKISYMLWKASSITDLKYAGLLIGQKRLREYLLKKKKKMVQKGEIEREEEIGT